MDLLLIAIDDSKQLRPLSVHGMLWLQTHFEDSEWNAIASNQARIPITDAKFLSEDAKAAGLIVNSLPELSIKSNL